QSARQQIWHQNELRSHLFAFITHAIRTSSNETAAVKRLWEWKQSVTRRQAAYRKLSSEPEAADLLQQLAELAGNASLLLHSMPQSPIDNAGAEVRKRFTAERLSRMERLRELNRMQENIEQQLAAAAKKRGLDLEAPELQQIRQALPEETALVEFVKYVHIAAAGEPSAGQKPDVRYAACIVTAKAKPVVVDLGASRKLEDSIIRFRRPFTAKTVTNEMLTDSERAAGQLRSEFWRPLQNHLPGIETVLISPDGAIGILPFAALPGSVPETYLLEDYRFAMLPAAAALLDSDDGDQAIGYASMLLVGDVDYGATSELQLASSEPDRSIYAKPLPGTSRELEAIRRMRDAQRLTTKLTSLTADQATESNLLKLAPNHQLLHIATHGFFQSQTDDFDAAAPGSSTRPASLPEQNPVDPLLRNFMPGYLSGLALAGCNTRSQRSGGSIDGVLHSAEVESNSLENVDTVVLSACETALGQEIGGEGLIGLQRAFHVAGVDTVIASLWKVDDQATASFMEKFYTNLLQHRMGKLDALRDAQLQMLKQHRAKMDQNPRGLGAKPSKIQATKPAVKSASPPRVPAAAYWAAFQLSGHW
ncbi:MAG TPA: CHAT domain-containing protein, partial [Pelovirga sp.]|nr:CHAT domain-containing protein [Pelovirga sp.]